MARIMTHEDVLRHMERKYPGITKEVQEEMASLRIAYKIAELRRRRHLTQGELARRAGLKQSNIARMEHPGYTDYKVSTLSRIAKAMRTHLNISFV